MVLTNVIEFAVLKVLHNLVSMQKFLFADNCWSRQSYDKCPIWPNICIDLSETPNSFMKTRLGLKIKKHFQFHKNTFLFKTLCIKMRKHAEVFHINKGYKLAIAVFIPILSFWK